MNTCTASGLLLYFGFIIILVGGFRCIRDIKVCVGPQSVFEVGKWRFSELIHLRVESV